MKSIFASKTFWFNVAALLFAVLSQFGYTGELPGEWAVFVPVIVAITNIILRLATSKPIAGPVAARLSGRK